MTSPSTPQHGKIGALYRWRPNGFIGNGLNDGSWGLAYSGADSAYYEVEIDGNGTPDTFQWRKNGGAWTTDVDITGAAQTLDDDQTITFDATTGHTIGDKWVIGNLKDEPTTEVGSSAQITDATMRILNPNRTPTFTDDGGKNVLQVDHSRGSATFDGAVGTVDVDGNNGYIPEQALEKCGYVYEWTLDVAVDLAEVPKFQDKWKSWVVGLTGGTGSAGSYFIGVDSFFDLVEEAAGNLRDYHFLKLFNYDPDDDMTGDHFNVWAEISGMNVAAPIGDVVKEGIQFTLHGAPGFTANT